MDSDLPALDTQDTAGNPGVSIGGLPDLDASQGTPQQGARGGVDAMDDEGPAHTPDSAPGAGMPATPGGLRTPLSVPRPELGAPLGLIRSGAVPASVSDMVSSLQRSALDMSTQQIIMMHMYQQCLVLWSLNAYRAALMSSLHNVHLCGLLIAIPP